MENNMQTDLKGPEAVKTVLTSLRAAQKELVKAKRWSYADILLGSYICIRIMRRCAAKAKEQLEIAEEAGRAYGYGGVRPGMHLPSELFDPSCFDTDRLPLDGIAYDVDLQSAIANMVNELKDVIGRVESIDRMLQV